MQASEPNSPDRSGEHLDMRMGGEAGQQAEHVVLISRFMEYHEAEWFDGGPSCSGATTIASRVLSTIAFSSSCSGCGTPNLSRVCWKSSTKHSHSLGVIMRWRCESP